MRVHDAPHDKAEAKQQQRREHVADALTGQPAADLARGEQAAGHRGTDPERPAVTAARECEQGHDDRQGRLERGLVREVEHGQEFQAPAATVTTTATVAGARNRQHSGTVHQQQERRVHGHRPGAPRPSRSVRGQAPVLRQVDRAQRHDGQRYQPPGNG